MRTPEFNRLMEDFSQKSDSIKEQISKMLYLIADGKVPAKQDVYDFGEAVDTLQADYESIYSLTKESVSAGELPVEGSSVSEYAIAMETSEKKRIAEKLKGISATLMQFISVRSLVDAYAQALAPYQKTANVMLENLKSLRDNAIPNEIMEVSNGHELFLTAMEIEDFGSDSAIELLDSLDKIYPSRVQVGLAQKKYYLPNEASDPAEHSSDDGSTGLGCVPDYGLLKPSPAQDKISDTTKSDEEKSSDTTINILTSKYRIKDTKASASSFKSDILRMPQLIRTILPLFTNLGALTSDQATRFGVCMDCFDTTAADAVKEALELLAAKGYVTAYEMGSLHDTAYCLSHIGHVCMRKDSIAVKMREFWDISYGEYKFVGGEQMDETALATVIANNDLLLSYFEGIKSQVDADTYAVVKTSVKWLGDNYQAAIFWNEEQYVCAIAGAPFVTHNFGHKHILMIADELPAVAALPATSQSQVIFVYAGGSLYRLDGEWVALSAEEGFAIADIEADSMPDCVEMTDKKDTALAQEPLTDWHKQEIAETIGINDSELSGRQEPIAFKDNAIEECRLPTSERSEALLLLERIQEFLNSPQVPSDEEFVSTIYSLLDASAKDSEESNKSLTNAILLSKTASYISDNQKCRTLYQQLALATCLFPNETDYSGMAIVPAFPEYNARVEGMMLSTFMIALLSPVQKHDYLLYSRAKALHDDYEKFFPSYLYLKPLFHKLISIEDATPEGFSDSIIGLLGDNAERTAFLKSLRDSAKALLSVPVIKAKMNGLPELCSSCFGPNSDLHLCMEVVSKDSYSEKDFIAFVLAEHSSDNALQQRIDREWNEATKGKRTNKLQLSFLARSQVEEAFKKRLNLMKAWVEHVDNRDDKRLPKLGKLKSELLQLLFESQITTLENGALGNDRVVFWALTFMCQKLSGEEKMQRPPFADLLLTGHISLDDEWNPILESSLTNVKYYEPWRNVLRHIITPELSFEQIKENVFRPSSRLFDNLHQLEQIGKLLDDSDAFVPTALDLHQAVASAEDYAKAFTDKLEMAYTYNRIDETDKESLLAILAQHKESFLATQDFACWRAFINALEQQVDEMSESRKKQLRSTLNAKRATLSVGVVSPLLDEAEKLLEKDSNCAVAEEYINRFDNGETELSEKLYSVLHDSDSFSDFVSDKVFVPIYSACMRDPGRTLKSFGADFLDKHTPKDWTARLRENSKKMLETWPIRKDMPSTASQVNELFKYIGLDATRAEKIKNPKVELYHLHVSKLARNQADYTHPISAFGTQLKSPLPVVVLFGSFTAKQLVDTVTSLNLGATALVLMDRAYDLSARRQMAEIFRTATSRQNSFLLIDRVLFLYLAMHQETERLPIMLKCTLPYTAYQPFVRDGGSTADEMFCGRTRELSEIMNPGGACFVYGGRQLGKTALLERAESRCAKPESREYAVYSNIIGCHDENDFVVKIVSDINRKTNLSLASVSTITELCRNLETAFRDKKITTMLLLLDEADNFLASISKVNYALLQPLIDLKRESKNYFKFVFAGLHNVCRAQNATANNGVLGQLGTPLCIKPLSPTDALLLISRPLRYIGFQIDQYPHLETILTNTNYYPGILQFFGYTLVQTFNSHYAKYYRAADGHPPFTLQDEQLGSVMNSADLNQSVRDKFRWSLELDPRYFMLARCVAMLYHLSDGNASHSSLGFSVDEIRSMADDYSIHCLETEVRSSYVILLDEMVDMGILSKPKDEIYRLRRRSFINIIGSDMNKLDEEIIRTNEEEAI